MSLSRLIVRLATVRALKGATLAGDAVFDSIVDPQDQRVSQVQRPVVIVYTDDHQTTPDARVDQLGGASACDLVLEIAIAGRASVKSDDGTESQTIVAAADADEAREYLLDLMERQIMVALTGARGPWPDLWRLFVVKVTDRVSRRGAFEQARLAARQITLTCDLLMDPPAVDYTPSGAWASAIATFKDDATLAPLAPILRAHIKGIDGSAADGAAAALGINRDTLASLGVGPITGDDADDAPLETIELPTGDITSG